MNWGNLDDLSDFILSAGGLAWMLYASVLVYLLMGRQKDLSSVFSVTIWVICDLAVIAITPYLYDSIVDGSIQVRWWYPSFIIIYALSALVITIFHQSNQLDMSRTTLLVLSLLLILASMDAIMHLDKLTVVALEDIYHYAVPSLKIMAAYLLWKFCSKEVGVGT